MIKHFFHRSTQRLIAALSYLSILAILLSISTGVGTLLAYVLTSQIRVYARISPFIAFMCLTAFLLVVQTWWQKKLLAGLMIALITVSLIDQTVWYAPRTSVIQSGFNTDQNLVQQIEAGLPTGSAIFQLPYKAFPESAPIDQLEDYELLKPYLQSRQLNWSYAGIKGRPGDQWYQRVAGQPIDQLVVTIKEQGFAGILINRRGYSDQGRTIEASLSAVIKTPPIISQDKINIYYSLK
jgi:phosphoglycerol transferase